MICKPLILEPGTHYGGEEHARGFRLWGLGIYPQFRYLNIASSGCFLEERVGQSVSHVLDVVFMVRGRFKTLGSLSNFVQLADFGLGSWPWIAQKQ